MVSRPCVCPVGTRGFVASLSLLSPPCLGGAHCGLPPLAHAPANNPSPAARYPASPLIKQWLRAFRGWMLARLTSASL